MAVTRKMREHTLSVGKDAAVPLNHITALMKISDNVVAEARSEGKRVRAVPSSQRIIRPANERVLTISSQECLLSQTAVNNLLTDAAYTVPPGVPMMKESFVTVTFRLD